jgi:hypothetical protein
MDGCGGGGGEQGAAPVRRRRAARSFNAECTRFDLRIDLLLETHADDACCCQVRNVIAGYRRTAPIEQLVMIGLGWAGLCNEEKVCEKTVRTFVVRGASDLSVCRSHESFVAFWLCDGLPGDVTVPSHCVVLRTRLDWH